MPSEPVALAKEAGQIRATLALLADLSQVLDKEEMSPGKSWMGVKQRQKGTKSPDEGPLSLEKSLCFWTPHSKIWPMECGWK